ncbi:BrnT family toxin [Gammaproteobacteria bacterium]
MARGCQGGGKIVFTANCLYNLLMITHDPPKRQANLKKHEIDLADCECVFDAPLLTEEDTSEPYGEQRLKSLCWLNGRVAVLVWTDRETGPHLISCRYGDKRETERYFKKFL